MSSGGFGGSNGASASADAGAGAGVGVTPADDPALASPASMLSLARRLRRASTNAPASASASASAPTSTSTSSGMARSNILVSLSFRACELRRMDGFLGWADSYLQLLRLKDQVWSELAATSVVAGEKNPRWEGIAVKLSKMRAAPAADQVGAGADAALAATSTPSTASAPAAAAAADPLSGSDYPLVVKCWHWKKREDAELIGLFETTLSELQSRSSAMQEAAPALSPGAGSDAQPPPLASFADGGLLAPFAFPLVDPTAALAPASPKRNAPKHAGLVYCTAAVLSIKDSNKRKSNKSKRRTLGQSVLREASFDVPSEASRSKAPQQ